VNVIKHKRIRDLILFIESHWSDRHTTEGPPDWKGHGIRRLATLESRLLWIVAGSHAHPRGGRVSYAKGANQLELRPVSPQILLLI